MKSNIISWGILGCGDVAEIKSGPAFQKVSNSALVSVMRRNEEKVADFARRHQVPHWTTNALELIESNTVNAIYIATPPSSHLQYALLAIKAGKNIYLEKPMVLNSDEAKILTNAADKSSVKITIAHYRRKLPVFLKIKELLDSNFIGKISQVELIIQQSKNANLIAKTSDNWRLNPEISGGGYFHDIAPHQIDLMCYYFGEVIRIKKTAVPEIQIENDFVKGEILFKNNITFKGSWNFNAQKDLDNCTIYGENGMISFSFYGDEILVSGNEGTKIYSYSNPKHVQQPMIEHTVGYFLGQNTNPCTVKDASIVTEILDVFTNNNIDV